MGRSTAPESQPMREDRLRQLNTFLKLQKTWVQNHPDVKRVVAEALLNGHMEEVHTLMNKSPSTLIFKSCSDDVKKKPLGPSPFLIVKGWMKRPCCDKTVDRWVLKMFWKIIDVAPQLLLLKARFGNRNEKYGTVADFIKFLLSQKNIEQTRKSGLQHLLEILP